jgi:3'(2'), 5'-bisphosphate nucleotidase
VAGGAVKIPLGKRKTDFLELESLVNLVCQAGKAIMTYYAAGDIEFELKGDRSPVTEADRVSQKIMLDGLNRLTPTIPVISEETMLPSFDTRQAMRRLWLLDPMDGTREFVEHGRDFTINLALIEDNQPVLGFIYIPFSETLYMGGQSLPVSKWHQGSTTQLAGRRINDAVSPITVVSSRRRGKELLRPYLYRLRQHFEEVVVQEAGSAVKYALLAEGNADLYLCCGPTGEWDTAAGHALLKQMGGEIYDFAANSLAYNRRDSVTNPWCYAVADADFDWHAILGDARR